MKTFLAILLMISLSIIPVQGEGYVVLGSNDGSIIEASNEEVQRSVASISKIMTAIVALESGDYNDLWTVGEEIAHVEGSSIYLTVGQKVSMRSLLYGLMLKSGNDAAVAIAFHVGKSVEKFVAQMNQFAIKLGMNNSIFHNPHGYDVNEDGNLSTPLDMAILMRYAMQNKTFREIVATKHYQSEWGARWKNSNKLLFNFPFTMGGKTGYTSLAGETLVSVGKKDNLEIIIVTLDVPNRWSFHQEKYETILNKYHVYTIMEEGTYTIDGYEVIVDEPFNVIVEDKNFKKNNFSAFLDKQKNEYVITYESSNHKVLKKYPIKKLRQSFCFWRWCI